MATRSRGRRSDYTWQGLAAGAAGISIAANAQAIQTIVTLANAGTIMRCRGEVVASVDGPADGDKVGIGVGLIVVNDDAVAAGAAAVPSPLNDLDAEWIWHGFLLLQIQAGTGVGASLNVGGVVDRLTCDSKAMRRFKQNQVLAFAMHTVGISGTAASDITFGFRTLLAL